MLVTRQKVLKNFWYATLPIGKLADGPKTFRLLGQDIVLFLDHAGEPAALEDRCCHRTAKLSKGWIKDGNIVCGYHGWEYDRDGKLVNVPQFPFEQPVPDAKAKNFKTASRYGYVWVCLGEPLQPLPDVPYDQEPGIRVIHQFDDKWNCGALRMMENSFDNAHFAFVHKGTFGDINQPKPEKYEITETDYGFEAETIVTVRNPPNAARITGTSEPWTKRQMKNKWFMPFCRMMDMMYPSGLRHAILNSRRRSTTAPSSSCRSCSATTAKKIARRRSCAPGTARSSRRTARFWNRPTPTRSST